MTTPTDHDHDRKIAREAAEQDIRWLGNPASKSTADAIRIKTDIILAAADKIAAERNTGWPKDRREELALLKELLREARTINHGSGCIERIARCQALANKLLGIDLDNARDSFMGFLIEKAAGSARAKEEKP